MVDFGITGDRARMRVAMLTPRENQIAELVAMGEMRPQIARTLNMSPQTVDTHLIRIRRKLVVEETYGIGRIWFAALHA